jgi:hypothetical protein
MCACTAGFSKDCPYSFVIPSQRESVFGGKLAKTDFSRFPIRANLVQFGGVYVTVVKCVSLQFLSDAVAQFFHHWKYFVRESCLRRKRRQI